MEEKEINPLESLDIIAKMVDKAKFNYSVDSFYYIMWGWLVFVASLASFLLAPVLKENTGLIWLLMPLGGIVSFIYGAKQSKTQKVVTHIETSINQLWLTLGFAFIAIMIAAYSHILLEIIPLFILLYAIGIFYTGRILKFMPMVIGGALCFPLFIACLLFSEMDEKNYSYQLLVLAIAILVSYIIPGHLLKAKYKK